MNGRRLVRDVGGALRFAHLRGLGVPLDDLDRLDVATGSIRESGLYLDAETGERRLFQEGALVPLGVWIAQRDLDDVVSSEAADELASKRSSYDPSYPAE